MITSRVVTGTRSRIWQANAVEAEVAVVTDDVSASFARAVEAGATVAAEPKEKPWGQTVSCVRDLNGFLVEICSPMAQ